MTGLSENALRRTPLFDEHVALGARMVPFAGWEMPLEYAGIAEEHRQTRAHCGIFDVAHMAEFRVFGFGALDFLQRLLTNDLMAISEVGAAQYTLMCEEGGGIVDDLIVYRSGDLEYLIVANAGNRETDFAWLREHCPSGVELVDESDRTALIAVQGPEALGIIGELAGPEWDPPPRFRIAQATLDTLPALVARTGYTGEDGVEVFTRAADGPRLWRSLLSFPKVSPAGLGARDTLRLEMGYPLYGNDIDRAIDPVSAGLSWVVAPDKGEFVGRDAILAIKESGPHRRLVGLRAEGGIPRPGMSVLREGHEVGKVTSGTFSPTLSTGIAMATVPSEHSAPGTPLDVLVRRKTVPVVVAEMPFVTGTSLSAQ